MSWELSSERPIYAQIIEKVMIDIVSGHYQPGEKLPSVRDLASEAAVNPNTMQKALSELERSGLVYSQRTSGRFITEDYTMIENAKKELAHTQIEEFMKKMNQLGLSKEETITLIQNSKEGDS
ncbi:MAG: GntR family transcriptional regulator [Lachnospiraceae bacterium]|nr:GntR family transcriptional regulator [Lachnospiraceae bacterium]